MRYQAALYDSDRWNELALRPGDIIISTPPKCGTTWTQMICALLVFQDPVLPQPLSTLSPWLDMLIRARCDVVADLEAQEHRRFIKTHTPLDGLPHDPSITYICVARDPRDVALSMHNHLDNMDLVAFFTAREKAAARDGLVLEPLAPPRPRPDSPYERFWLWVDDETPTTETGSSLLRTLRHLETFWDPPAALDVVMLHFDDLRADLAGQMRALAERLAISVPEDRWPALVHAATFDEMRTRASQVAPNARIGAWLDNERFFNRGTSGQWRELLDDTDLERYRARAEAIGPADLVAWVHRDGDPSAAG